MPYLGTWPLSSTLTVYLQTISPETACGLSADSLPIYRVYHDMVATPLTTGSFAILDGGNVSGFYGASFVLSGSHGFSASGNYCIWKHATVSGISAAQLDTFRIFVST